jgi:hypothetical protein
MVVHTHSFHEAMVAEGASLLVLVGYFADVLPAIATAAGLVWYALCIWESPPIQRLRDRWKRS